MDPVDHALRVGRRAVGLGVRQISACLGEGRLDVRGQQPDRFEQGVAAVLELGRLVDLGRGGRFLLDQG